MKNNLLGIIIGITVAVIMVGSVLAVAADPEQYRTYVNNTEGYAATIATADDDLDITMSWDSTTKKLIVNDINYTYSVNDIAYFSDTSMLKTTTVSPFCEWIHDGTLTTGLKSIELTISNGTVSAEWVTSEDVSGSATSTYEWICVRDNAGSDRIGNVITSSKSVYYTEDAPIYASRTVSGKVLAWIGTTAYYDGSDYDATLNGTQYKNGVYSATLTFQSTSDLTTEISGTAYSPYYYAVAGTLDASSEAENEWWGLIQLIPLMMVIAILVMAIQIVYTKRD